MSLSSYRGVTQQHTTNSVVACSYCKSVFSSNDSKNHVCTPPSADSLRTFGCCWKCGTRYNILDIHHCISPPAQTQEDLDQVCARIAKLDQQMKDHADKLEKIHSEMDQVVSRLERLAKNAQSMSFDPPL